MAWTKSNTTKHTHPVVFGRKVDGCPRCEELKAGAAPIQWAPSFKQRDAQRCREIAAHFSSHQHLSGGCGVVCTFGEW